MKNSKLIVIIFVALFTLVRVIHFQSAFNFSADQANFSIRALELWQNRELTLVGPTAAFGGSDGRNLIQSSMIYYAVLGFLLPVGFDPVGASLLFVLVAGVLVGFLYRGVELLGNRRVATFVTAVYVFMPFFVNYTRFLWNPNFQLALMPVFIWTLGRWSEAKSTDKWKWNFLGGTVLGFGFLFHYQLTAVVGAMGLYLLLKGQLKFLSIFLAGFLLGALPLVAFEFNSGFYLNKTIFYILQNWQKVEKSTSSATGFMPPGHYYSSILLLLITLVAVKLKNIFFSTKNHVIITIVTIFIFIFGFISVLQKPAHGFGMAANWNYVLEKKSFQLIALAVEDRQLSNYNIANTIYSTIAPVTHFLLMRDNWLGGELSDGLADNYFTNKYLFVITSSDGKSLTHNPAYEISTFESATTLETWRLNDFYQLVLLERDV